MRAWNAKFNPKWSWLHDHLRRTVDCAPYQTHCTSGSLCCNTRLSRPVCATDTQTPSGAAKLSHSQTVKLLAQTKFRVHSFAQPVKCSHLHQPADMQEVLQPSRAKKFFSKKCLTLGWFVFVIAANRTR